MAKGTVTFKETYGTAQTDTVVLSPASPKQIVVWGAKLETTEDGTAEIKFATSGDIILSRSLTGSTKATNMFLEGATDEDIIVTCPANTTVTVFFDEL